MRPGMKPAWLMWGRRGSIYSSLEIAARAWMKQKPEKYSPGKGGIICSPDEVLYECEREEGVGKGIHKGSFREDTWDEAGRNGS